MVRGGRHDCRLPLLHYSKLLLLVIPCQVAPQQSLTPFHQTNVFYHFQNWNQRFFLKSFREFSQGPFPTTSNFTHTKWKRGESILFLSERLKQLLGTRKK